MGCIWSEATAIAAYFWSCDFIECNVYVIRHVFSVIDQHRRSSLAFCFVQPHLKAQDDGLRNRRDEVESPILPCGNAFALISSFLKIFFTYYYPLSWFNSRNTSSQRSDNVPPRTAYKAKCGGAEAHCIADLALDPFSSLIPFSFKFFG